MAISMSGTTLTFNDATTQTSAGVIFAAGTALLFQQTSAPTGWTKVTTYSNHALRLVNGAVGTGGTVAFTTAFASGLSAGATTLSTAQMPSHTHSTNIRLPVGACCASPLSTAPFYYTVGGFISTSGAGSSSSHDHTLPSFAVQYVDVIIATKS